MVNLQVWETSGASGKWLIPLLVKGGSKFPPPLMSYQGGVV